MDRDEVIAILRSHEPELKAAGVARLRLFGSVARGEYGAESDIDIVDAFEERNGGISLLDLVHLENRLSDLLRAQVDLVQEKSLKTRVRQTVEREAVVAFQGSRSAAAGHSRQHQPDRTFSDGQECSRYSGR